MMKLVYHNFAKNSIPNNGFAYDLGNIFGYFRVIFWIPLCPKNAERVKRVLGTHFLC